MAEDTMWLVAVGGEGMWLVAIGREGMGVEAEAGEDNVSGSVP